MEHQNNKPKTERRGASALMRWLGVLLIATVLISCDQTDKQDWEYEIGEVAVHKLTADTVLVVDRYSLASGIILIRQNDYETMKAREEELRKIPQ